MNYSMMYLSDLRRERKHLRAEGKSAEIKLIDVELVKRAKDRWIHQKIEEFEQAKKNYLIAKVICDVISEKLNALNAPINKAESEGKMHIDKWARQVTHNEFKLGYPQAQEVLRQTEKALFEIAKTILMEKGTAKQQEIIAKVFADGPKFMHIRDKLLDLTLRLNPTK